MKPGEKNRVEYINRRAYELATSGRFRNERLVIAALVKEGYPEAEELLNTKNIGNDLRRLCSEHWGGRKS